MQIEKMIVGPLQVNCYLLWCSTTREAIVVDAGDDASRISDRLQQLDLKLKMIVNTHGHFDHQGGVRALVDQTGAPFLMHPADQPLLKEAQSHANFFDVSTTVAPEPDSPLEHGMILRFGEQTLEVRHTPGHSPGGVCLVGQGVVFSGDTLFAGSIGRTDFPLGNHEQLLQSVRTQLLTLPEETLVYPGHGPETRIGNEKTSNPFLR